MDKRISFKLFFTVIWRSICQVFQFIAKIFGYKDESTYAKVIWRIFAGCITSLVCLFTFGIFYCFVNDIIYPKWVKPHTSENFYNSKYISNYIVFQEMYTSETGRIYDESEKKVLVSGIDWVVTSEDYDSLAVFSKDGKRGYINRFTGEIKIPLLFSKAWTFSEGLAAVEKNKKLLFIDHNGNVVIDNNLQVHFDSPSYVFQNGYCPIKDSVTGKTGLIDKKGNWILEPIYDKIYQDSGFWKVESKGLLGLYSKSLKLIFPITNTDIWISERDKTVEIRTAEHIGKRYDFDGNILVDFVIDEISTMIYETNELRNDLPDELDEVISNKRVYGIANCKEYKVRSGRFKDYCGLLDRKGKRITDPIYNQIDAIGKNLYLCLPDGIIINDRGELVK